MLQLILGILKVTGILLLTVILLILLALLALLFVPVQYEAAGKKKKKAMAARVKISWLFHLIGVQAVYLEGRLQIRIKLFGITMKKMRWGQGGEGPSKGEGAGKERKNPEGKPSGITLPEKNKAAGGEEDSLQEVPAIFRSPLPSPAPSEDSSLEPSGEDEKISERRKRSGKILGRLGKGGALALRAAVDFLKKTVDVILYLPQRMLDWAEQIGRMVSGGEGFAQAFARKREELEERIAPFLTSESRALYGRLLDHGRYLLKHYGPRKIAGWVRVGTGMPDVTAMACGLIYLLLPAAACEFEVKPDFSESVLEGDVALSGHVRSCCLMKVAFSLWRDKEFRAMLGRVKGGI